MTEKASRSFVVAEQLRTLDKRFKDVLSKDADAKESY